VWLASIAAPGGSNDDVAIYRPLLDHLRSAPPVTLIHPVTLAEHVYQGSCHLHCDAGARTHDPRTLRTLRRQGMIADWCRVPDARISCGPRGNSFVALGRVIRMRPGVRVAPILDLRPGMRYVEAEAATAKSAYVPAAVAVDALLYLPCADRSPEGCRFPDVTMYRYFLQPQPDGTYRVVARIPTGAV
jgi:hypothetical protein